jgi:hypothetical protein
VLQPVVRVEKSSLPHRPAPRITSLSQADAPPPIIRGFHQIDDEDQGNESLEPDRKSILIFDNR